MNSEQRTSVSSSEFSTVNTKARRPGGPIIGLLLLLCATPVLVAGAIRMFGLDQTKYTAALVALTPYVLLASAGMMLFALLFRRWILGLVLAIATAILTVIVVPRAFPDARSVALGQPVQVLSVNMFWGKADPNAIVDLVQTYAVDVVSLQELTPEAVSALDEAGLARELPYRHFQARPGASGSGLISRYPLRPIELGKPAAFAQPAALIDLPGPQDMEIMAVHAQIPVGSAGAEPWLRELTSLPEPKTEGPVRILAGDFNATLDHSPLRRLLGQGYRDAADQAGAALKTTWPQRRAMIPPVTLDHVLVDSRCPVDRFDTFDIPGSDHAAVLTWFTVSEST